MGASTSSSSATPAAAAAASASVDAAALSRHFYDKGVSEASFHYEGVLEAERSNHVVLGAAACALTFVFTYGYATYTAAARTAAVAAKLEKALARNRTLGRALQKQRARNALSGRNTDLEKIQAEQVLIRTELEKLSAAFGKQ